MEKHIWLELVKINTPNGLYSTESNSSRGEIKFFIWVIHSVWLIVRMILNDVSAQVKPSKSNRPCVPSHLQKKVSSCGLFWRKVLFYLFPKWETLVYEIVAVGLFLFEYPERMCSWPMRGNFLFWKPYKCVVFHPEYHDDGKPIPFASETKYLILVWWTQRQKKNSSDSCIVITERISVRINRFLKRSKVEGTRPNCECVQLGMRRFGTKSYIWYRSTLSWID